MKFQQGFSLLELLVAMAVFAIMASLAYTGLNAVITSVDVIENQQQQSRTLHRALMLMQQDLQMTLDRPVRDRLGGQAPAFVTEPGDGLFHLTRLGRANPYQQPISQLARVGWRLQGDALQRISWAPIDGDSLPSLPDSLWQTQAEGIDSVTLWVFDSEQRRQRHWPLPGVDQSLPQAVMLQISLKQGPDVQMTVAMPRDWPDLNSDEQDDE